MSTTGTDLPAGLIDVWAFLDSTKRLIKLHNEANATLHKMARAVLFEQAKKRGIEGFTSDHQTTLINAISVTLGFGGSQSMDPWKFYSPRKFTHIRKCDFTPVRVLDEDKPNVLVLGMISTDRATVTQEVLARDFYKV